MDQISGAHSRQNRRAGPQGLGVTHNLETSDIADHVSKFLDKIWEARDIESIESFVDSMDIPRDRAPELFFAWKAICYYQLRRVRSSHP